jgi:hypothetical protein
MRVRYVMQYSVWKLVFLKDKISTEWILKITVLYKRACKCVTADRTRGWKQRQRQLLLSEVPCLDHVKGPQH